MFKKRKTKSPKDVLLFISNTYEPINGNVLGGQLSLDNLNSYFINSTAKQEEEPTGIGTCNNRILKLRSSENKWLKNETKIIKFETIPVETPRNQSKVICLNYDEDLFKQSEKIHPNTLKTEDNVFQLLHSNIKTESKEFKSRKAKDGGKNHNVVLLNYFLKIYSLIRLLLRKSHWFTHVEQNFQIFLNNKKNRNTSRMITKNLYSSKMVDFFLGIITLYYLLEHKSIVLDSILQSTKFIIDGLKHVLNSLMDSPGGLKLNYALNHTLAIFFFYHISLWMAFIQSIFTVSPSIVYVFAALGSFGLSYQITLCADLIMFLTFHVYCIYVYAARFYRVQIYTITSLWRLFIGRKQNPLKHRVDSFQYSHNQLFIGTLGFTILLFLLPTTFLYYIVFTMFRIWVLIVCQYLHSIAKYLSSIPLYLIILRLIGSPTIKGSVRIYTTKNRENNTLQLHASLDFLKTWFSNDTAVKTAAIDKLEASERSLNEYINNLCTGKLL